MRKLLTFTCLLVLASCSTEAPVVLKEVTKLVERQGIKYEINSTTPFTGIEITESSDSLYKTEYKNGKEVGLLEYYNNGQLRAKNNFKNGTFEEYHENGQLVGRINFENGTYEEYHENGQLKKKVNFNKQDFNGSGSVGPYEEYHENGQLKEKGNFIKNGTNDGPYEEYYLNGQLKEKGTYKDGEKVGTWEEYDEEGVPQNN